MVVDQAELFLFHLPNQVGVRLHIKQPDIVSYYSKYYDALWEAAVKIRKGDEMDGEVIESLKRCGEMSRQQ
jgi:hypothetical protein